MRPRAWQLALCAAAMLLCAQQCSALKSEKQITLDADGCQGVQWNALVSCTLQYNTSGDCCSLCEPFHTCTQGDKFGYSVTFDLHPLAPGCDAANVRVSKLYVQVRLQPVTISISASWRMQCDRTVHCGAQQLCRSMPRSAPSQEACVDRRDNNWEVKLEKEHILCSKAVYPDTTTCKQAGFCTASPHGLREGSM
jgi:hypothetical protein